MNPAEYFKQLYAKYRSIDSQRIQPGQKDISPTLGEKLGIKSGKVRKQLPKKMMDREFNNKFHIRGEK